MEQSIRFTRSRDRVLIAYAISGRGPPLVKAANWLTHLEFDWNSPLWRHWLEALTRDHTLVRYDERGCGLSDRRAEDLSLDAFVGDLERVVDALGLEPFPLLGMSQGGPVSIAYAARHPHRVTQLILYGTYALGWSLRGNPGFRRRMEALVQLIEDGWGRDNPAFRQVFTSMFIPEGSAEQVRWMNDLQRHSTRPQVAARLEREFGRFDVTELLREIRCPVLVLHARGDEVVPFDEGRKLAAGIADACFVPLESRNHILLQDEAAWPRFLGEVRGFLGVAEPVPPVDAEFLERLTPRERQVLEGLAAGLSNDAIAGGLSIATKTVKNHVTRIFAKLEVRTRPEAIVRAREAGLGRGSAEFRED